MKKHILRASALLLTALMLTTATACFRTNKTTEQPSPTLPSTAATEATPTQPDETTAGTASEPSTTPEPETTPEPTPTPDLEPSDFIGEEVDKGRKKLTLNGAEKVEGLLLNGNYLVTIESQFKLDPDVPEGAVYVRSYNMANGSRVIDYKLPSSYYGSFMTIDAGGFAHWDELGNFIYFKDAKDTDPFVFKDKENSFEGTREYDFYPDGSYLCDDKNSFIFGNVFDGTSETFEYEIPEGFDYSYVWKRDGSIVYVCFGIYDGIDGTPDVYAYDMTDRSLTKTDLLPYDDYEYGTDAFTIVNNHDGTMTIQYKDGATPDVTVDLYRRSEYIVNVCNEYFITSYYHTDSPMVHTVYAIDGTPLYRGELSPDGFFGNSILCENGFFYTYTCYEDYECTEASACYLDLTAVDHPDRPDKNVELSNYAKTIENAYPVTILYGADAIIDFPDFKGEVMDDPFEIIDTIELIGVFLGEFPEGFFDEMFSDTGHGNPTHLTICLTGALAPTTGYGISNPAAYAYYDSDMQYIVIDITQTYSLRTNLAHETMHAIDRYLDAVTDYDAYPDWSNYVPGMSVYNYSYKGDDGFDYYDSKYTPDDSGEVWFIDSYSKTYPTEDRARLFENMFTGSEYSTWLEFPNVCARMAYQCSVIRANFKCMENVETAHWEKLLTVDENAENEE